MRNQLILWAMFIVPWLSLFFMKMNDIRRYMPVALLAALTSVMIHEIGISLGWWVQLETNYPLQLPFYLIGLHPVLTMWVFKFTFPRFWKYIAFDTVLNLGFDFLFLGYLLPKMGIRRVGNLSPFAAFFVTTAHGILLYGYQVWQDRIFAAHYRETEMKK